MVKKEIITHQHYPLTKPLVINGRMIDEIVITSHYKEKHPDINDDLILELVQKLNNREFPPDEVNEPWEYFVEIITSYQGKRYKLVWYWRTGASFLGVRTCHRSKKKIWKEK